VLVIPGRLQGEPGIHIHRRMLRAALSDVRATDEASCVWIPGSFFARPGMTVETTSLRQRRHAFDLDQHLWVGQRGYDACGAGRVGCRAERLGIELVHISNIGGAGQ
jgi:hypothetical protein